jgi:hypothetical protein
MDRETADEIKRHFNVGILSLAIATVLLSAVGVALGDEAGTASGKLTVDGQTTPLTYAYARAGKSFFDPGKEDILIILSDVPIPEAALSDVFARHAMAVEGKLHAVEVSLNSEKQAVSGGLLHEAFSQTQGFVSVTGMHKFEAKTFDGKLVEGKLSMDKPDEFMKKTFQYSATFRAPVWHRPPPTASGAAAAQTAPGKAAIVFLKAAKAGKPADLKKILSAELSKQLDGPEGKNMLEGLKAMTPDPAIAQIESVDIQGNTAEVTVVEKSKDGSATSTIKLALEGGQWRVTGM